MFLISKGECEIIILSIGNEVPIFNSLYCFSDPLDWQGVFFMSYVIYTPPFRVQRAPMPVKPIPCTFYPIVCLWGDIFITQFLLKFLPLRNANPVATLPHSMVILLLSSIQLIRFRHFLSFFRIFVFHKLIPEWFYLLKLNILEIGS